MLRILSIDGGGIRGLLPLYFLAALEREAGVPLSRLFQLMAGTSTGGIIVAMLSAPGPHGQPLYTVEQVIEAYLSLGRQVFHASPGRAVAHLGGLIGPKYPAQRLQAFVQDYFGDLRLSQTVTPLLMPAYEIEQNTPWFFKTSYAKLHPNAVDDPLLSQAVLATSAAPSYFPPFALDQTHCFIDGGIFANNPAMCAYAEAKRLFPGQQQPFFLSLGTGSYHRAYTCAAAQSWGSLGWAIPLYHMSMNGSSTTVDYQMKAVVGSEQYYRFQLPLPRQAIAMDNASQRNLDLLSALAQQWIAKNQPKIRSLARILRDSDGRILR